MGRGTTAFILAACLAALFMVAPASAQVGLENSHSLDDCTGKTNPTPDALIAGCVAVIEIRPLGEEGSGLRL